MKTGDSDWRICPIHYECKGLARLSHQQQRQRLQQDTEQWLASGNRIETLDQGHCHGLSKYDPDNSSLFGVFHYG